MLALIVLEKELNPNTRSTRILVDELGQQYSVDLFCRDTGSNPKLFDGVVSVFSYRKPYPLLKILDYLGMWGARQLLKTIQKKTYNLILLRESKYLVLVPLIRYFSKNAEIILDIRENPYVRHPFQIILLSPFWRYFREVNVISPALKDLIYCKARRVPSLSYALPSLGFMRNCGDSIRNNHGKICFYGFIGANRNLKSLLTKMCVEQQLEVTVVGPGNADIIESLRSLKGVNVLSQLSYELGPHLLKDFDIGVLSNDLDRNSFYTIPGKLWEYLAVGMAVLTDERNFVAQFVLEHDIGWVLNGGSIRDEDLIEMRNSEIIARKNKNARNLIKVLIESKERLRIRIN
jgi:hypothetical protein